MSTPNVVVQLKYVLNTYKRGDKKSEKYLKDQKFYNSSGEKNYFVLYITDIYMPTLDKIALMFAGGTAFDSVLTFFMYIWFRRKINM